MQRIKDWSPFIAFVLLGILVIIMFKRCGLEPATVVIPEKALQDSFRTVIKYHDSVRVKEVLKWRTMTHITDSIKCYEVLVPFIAQCDTVIKIDSILISSLYSQHSNDSIIISKQDSIIRLDSVRIVKLDKKLKRTRRIALGLGAVLTGAIGVKLIP